MLTQRQTRIVLCSILITGVLLRIGLLYLNAHKHPSLFQRSAATVRAEINAAAPPYVNDFGFEIGNIAYSIVCRETGFASPFGGDTGPTAWVAPGSVMVYCLAFRLFGCFTTDALLFLFGISLLLSSAMIIIIYRTALLMFGNEPAALAAALVFALSLQDAEMYFQGYQQDFNLHSFWFISVFYFFMRYFVSKTARRLAAFSICAAIALLFIPVLAAAIAALFAVLFISQKASAARVLSTCMIALLIMAAIVGPYILYQKKRIGILAFIKSNGAFELYQGNRPESDGYLDDTLFAACHPAANAGEYRLYSSLGEAGYIESKRGLFRQEFSLERFVRTTANRCMYFFFVFRHHAELPSLTVWMLLRYIGYAIPGAALILFMFFSKRRFEPQSICACAYIGGYAMPYLFIAVMYRYSFPIITLSSILIGSLLRDMSTRPASQG